MATTIFVIVVLLRFFVPLAIPRFPLPAVVACLVIDAADQSIFQIFTDDPLPGYQSYDKALDVYYLAIAYISSMRSWREATAFEVNRFLYLYRLVGVTLFELLQWRWLLLVFPNTFEYFFIAYETVRTRWNPARLTALTVVSLAVAITVFIKFPQETWIHILKLDFTEFMAAHSYLWFVLAGLVVGAVVVWWKYHNRLPASDWAFTVDVDRHLPALADGSQIAQRFWSAVLAEKIVLLTLISVIFAQIMPDIRASNIGVALGVAVLVVLNAAISEFLRKRGRSWSSSRATVPRDARHQSRHRHRRCDYRSPATTPPHSAHCSWPSSCRFSSHCSTASERRANPSSSGSGRSPKRWPSGAPVAWTRRTPRVTEKLRGPASGRDDRADPKARLRSFLLRTPGPCLCRC